MTQEPLKYSGRCLVKEHAPNDYRPTYITKLALQFIYLDRTMAAPKVMHHDQKYTIFQMSS